MRAHLLNAFFSLVFAVLILSAAASHLTTQATVVVPIHVTAPADVIVSYGERTGNSLDLSDVVTIEISGPREVIERHRQQGTFKATYALEKPSDLSGTRAVSVEEILRKRIPKGLTLLEVSPATLELTYSQRVVALVYVSPGEVVGQPAPGYRITGIRVKPNRVQARGEASLLERFPGTSEGNPHYMTEPLKLSSDGAAPRSTVTVPLDVVPPAPGIEIATQVEVEVKIEPELIEAELEFPVVLVRKARDAEIVPLDYRIVAKQGSWTRKIKLRGPGVTLRALREALESKLATAQVPFVFVEDVGITGSVGGEDGLTIQIRGLPEGVEIADPLGPGQFQILLERAQK